MENLHLLSRKERSSVESEYGRNILYRYLRGVCLEWEGKVSNFSLTGEDLFYQVIFSLDTIRCCNEKLSGLDHCRYLWNEIVHYIDSRVVADESDKKNAASLVVAAVDNCLSIFDLDRYLDEIKLLKQRNEVCNGGSANVMQPMFDSWYGKAKKEELNVWLSDYWDSDVFISDDIAQMLSEMRDETHNNEEENKRLEFMADELSKLFYDNKNDAMQYLSEIRGLPSSQIHEITNRYYGERKISDINTKGKIFKIINEGGLIKETLSNWNIFVKYPRKK